MSLPIRTLPVVDSCTACGACCMHQGHPPGFAACFGGRRECAYPEDLEILATLPPSLREELADFYRTIAEHGNHRLGKPCLWFDPETRACRHYDFRPILCREFNRGSPACHQWRERLHIVVPKPAVHTDTSSSPRRDARE